MGGKLFCQSIWADYDRQVSCMGGFSPAWNVCNIRNWQGFTAFYRLRISLTWCTFSGSILVNRLRNLLIFDILYMGGRNAGRHKPHPSIKFLQELNYRDSPWISSACRDTPWPKGRCDGGRADCYPSRQATIRWMPHTENRYCLDGNSTVVRMRSWLNTS